MVEKHRGYAILKAFGNSVSKMLMTAFPEINWVIWKFKSLPKSTWSELKKNKEMQKSFVNFVAQELNIKNTDDWYTVTRKVISQNIEKKLGVNFSDLLQWVVILFLKL